MELEQTSLCLVNKVFFYNEYICSFDKKETRICHLYKTYYRGVFFLSHPTPTMIEGKYIHYKFLRENRFL